MPEVSEVKADGMTGVVVYSNVMLRTKLVVACNAHLIALQTVDLSCAAYHTFGQASQGILHAALRRSSPFGRKFLHVVTHPSLSVSANHLYVVTHPLSCLQVRS